MNNKFEYEDNRTWDDGWWAPPTVFEVAREGWQQIMESTPIVKGTPYEEFVPPSREDLESLVGLILVDVNGYGEHFKVLELNITGNGFCLYNISTDEELWWPIDRVMGMHLLLGR